MARTYGIHRTARALQVEDRKSTRLNSSHSQKSYADFCLKKRKHLSLRAELFRDVGERAALRHAQVPQRESNGHRDQLRIALRPHVCAGELLESSLRITAA